MSDRERVLLGFLELERVAPDTFRGHPRITPAEGLALFGGELLAQALIAARHTVPTGFVPSSLHGYFLRPGAPTRPTDFIVEDLHDDTPFVRRVTARQGDQPIWRMSCSFRLPSADPGGLPPPRLDPHPPADTAIVDQSWCPLVEMRVPQPSEGLAGLLLDHVWARVRAPLPDDPLVHLCLHAFVSDATSGFAGLDAEEIPPGGPSLDHAIWFFEAGRADDWVLHETAPVKLGGQRGLYRGRARGADGRVIALFAQEMLLRKPKPS